MNAIRRHYLRWRHRQQPWAGLLAPYHGDDVVSIDLETTGLDPRRDEILSIAAVPIRGGVVRVSERFTGLVAPGRDFDIESIRHHRLRPSEVADALPPRDAVRALLHWLGNRPLLGYNIGFDCAMLNRHVPAITGFALPNARLDLARAYAAWLRHARPTGDLDLRFDTLLDALNVPALGRHSALGDACTTAAAWLALSARRAA
ncbi:MAG: DNA polymerase III subunit epsilon [Lysobacterales bacterium CG17_big_fil_post_rev_8_21_14_2_50_64_11]|nr:MAG: DNA polymerase III subunit epsilon [Xanthomonadales bacterium CG17_big_fil_post_rev_8_21_14_2_50_64_11]PIX61446.1 MAG: DNA polymerase III subunit epsilon [Xanthomonadales bacterium CG_4_10_14_3_um_filter_64_11]